jgi:signal transduction histidine kinase
LSLAIRDDGTGFDTAANSPDQSGLGRSLIEAFVRQLRGELEVRSDEGTIVQVTFPAPLKEADSKPAAPHHSNVAHEPERTQKTAGGVS